MQQLDHSHTVLMPAGAVAAAMRLAGVPSMAGPGFAFSQSPVATVEVLRADGGWAVAQGDLTVQFA
jgi:hypothetical protein